MKITCIAGTRPEFIKMFPVVVELRRRGESPTIIATGQHTDLLRGTPFEDGMAPDVNLRIASSNDPLGYAENCECTLVRSLSENRPELVVVQGDTASAWAGAFAALQLGIPVAHVEAGIRSGDNEDPWPEEQFRSWIDMHAKYHYCATPANARNIHIWPDLPSLPGDTPITGNTGIDALYSHTKPVEQSQKVDRVLITLHRRESFGEPLREIVRGLIAGANQHKGLMFWWVTHPNPRVREALPVDRPRNLILVPPLGTVEFAQRLSVANAVISDSGGVQEEAAALGIPCIVARGKTDRPESVELGLAKVVGRTEAGILEGLAWALDTQIEPSTVFGDGKAAPRIVEHLLNGAT